MTRGPSLSWGVRTELIYGCVSVIWLASLVSSADIDGTSPSNGTVISGRAGTTREVQLETSPEVLAQCGKPVNLTCDASSDSGLGIKEMYWFSAVTELCRFENGKPLHEGPGVKCESTGSETGHRLTMTLLNVMPDSQGQYTCKLRSIRGIEYAKANITLQGCFGNSNHSSASDSESQLECRFYGIYPLGTVHWFQGNVNLTHDAATDTEEDQNRLFTIKSTLKIHKAPVTPVNCSLWIPGTRTYVATERIEVSQKAEHLPQEHAKPVGLPGSSPTLLVKLLWIPIMVGLVVVKSIT